MATGIYYGAIQQQTNNNLLIYNGGAGGLFLSGGGATAWTASSDRRLKHDINPLPTSTLDRIMALNPVTHHWKDAKQDEARGLQLGFIAQEVEGVFPEIVTHGDTTTITLANGDKQTIEKTLGVTQTDLRRNSRLQDCADDVQNDLVKPPGEAALKPRASPADSLSITYGGPMSATAREDHIELLVDINEFFDRVGIVGNYLELEWLGFKIESFSGSFRSERLPDLQHFCHENLDYHIVTYTGKGRYENRYVPGKVIYRLANGDRNPCLVLNHLIDPNRALVAEKTVCAVLAMLNDVEAGDH